MQKKKIVHNQHEYWHSFFHPMYENATEIPVLLFHFGTISRFINRTHLESILYLSYQTRIEQPLKSDKLTRPLSESQYLTNFIQFWLLIPWGGFSQSSSTDISGLKNNRFKEYLYCLQLLSTRWRILSL